MPLDTLNAATRLSRLAAAAMPARSFYTRSNFEVPAIDPKTWRLTVAGLVDDPLVLSMDDLRSLGEAKELITLECAGNGRIFMDPVPAGAPWGWGAVGVAEFAGTPLAGVLQTARPSDGVVEFVFTGLDRGLVEPEGEINYAFGLDADAALAEGPMLVWEMNGEPLTPDHGAPVRLLVPTSYGMSSVKWLTSITAIDVSFTGHFRLKYRYLGDPTAPEGDPVGLMRVRSLITSPADGDHLGGVSEFCGVAWSGTGAVETVALSIDGGAWIDTELGAPLGRFGPHPWSSMVSLKAGEHVIRSRATDSSGDTQPLEPIWNRNGYGNNVVQQISVTVV